MSSQAARPLTGGGNISARWPGQMAKRASRRQISLRDFTPNLGTLMSGGFSVFELSVRLYSQAATNPQHLHGSLKPWEVESLQLEVQRLKPLEEAIQAGYCFLSRILHFSTPLRSQIQIAILANLQRLSKVLQGLNAETEGLRQRLAEADGSFCACLPTGFSRIILP